MSSSHRRLPTASGPDTLPRAPRLLLVVIVTASLLSGCPWRSYEQIAAVHLDVLSSMTTKLRDTVEAGRRPSPEDVAELLYPLRRARQFAYQYRGDWQRPSYRAFVETLDLYEKLVNEVDAARVDDRRWQAYRGRLAAPAGAVLDQVRRTREALQQEN